MNKNESKDFRIMYSKSNPRPDEETCERMIDQPQAITIQATDGRIFTREFIYFKL